MKKRQSRLSQACELFLFHVALSLAGSVHAQTVDWIRQFTKSSIGYDVSADQLGNEFIAGWTDSDLNGSNAGGFDRFISKYNSAGNPVWTRQLGTTDDEFGYGVAADGLGNAYLCGLIRVKPGDSTKGDGFLAKYDTAGNIVWTREFVTSSFDEADKVAVDGFGNVFVAGDTAGNLFGANAGGSDAFVAKYNAAGTLQWSLQFGTDLTDFAGVSADSIGNAYIYGSTYASLFGSSQGTRDAYLAKHGPSGNLVWAKQLGTGSIDSITGVTVDASGNVYAAGYTEGSLVGTNSGDGDGFLIKYDPNGNVLWTRQFGTDKIDFIAGIAADPLGNIYVAGNTAGDLAQANAGPRDTFLLKYSPSGNLIWQLQLGTAQNDAGAGVSTDGLGNIYITGTTGGSLGVSNPGLNEAFLAKFHDVPEPCTPSLIVFAALVGFQPRRRPCGRRQRKPPNRLG